MDYTYHYQSPLGGMTMASEGENLTGLWFDGQRFFAETLDAEQIERNLPIFDETVRWLDIYFSGKEPGFTPAMRTRGTTFRKAVWEILLTIPYGKTVTYGEIAKETAVRTGAGRMSAQAVGNAVSHNAISLIIPCHRVVGRGGRLTGYAGGIEKKKCLLSMEQAEDTNQKASRSESLIFQGE